MDVRLKNRLTVGVTTISNIFIDQYLAGASGEYVKVYLYLLRHEGEPVSVEAVADALNHTEADVRRALSYWQRAGVLDESAAAEGGGGSSMGQEEYMPQSSGTAQTGCTSQPGYGAGDIRTFQPGCISQDIRTPQSGYAPQADRMPQSAAAQRASALSVSSSGNACDMDRLSRDETFTQLVYIAQKYLNKTFTPTDCQILGNLYANLKIAPELLEYLMEYCAQNNHSSLRYAEKVALNWHEKKITTVEEARAYSRSFSKESFAVMKAMGLTGRSPADFEYELMEKWFRSYGFTREIVLEACSRTIKAIHSPSFQYADRILTDWKEAGVRTLRDISALDKVRKEKEKSGEKNTAGGPAAPRGKRSGAGRASNRFHNLEEHGYDYDEMIWTMINAEKETGGKDGTQ